MSIRPRSPRAWVLCVGSPERRPAGVCAALRDAGLALLLRDDAASALEVMHTAPPNGVLCDVDLPDGDGPALTRWVRAHEGLAGTAVVVLGDGGLDWRLYAYRAGADVCLQASLAPSVIAAQMAALVRVGQRIRPSAEPTRTERPGHGALGGDLAHISLPSVLQALELERRTGVVEVMGHGGLGRLEIIRGHAVGAVFEGKRCAPVVALQGMLGVCEGRFMFRRARVRDLSTGDGTGNANGAVVVLRELLARAVVAMDHRAAHEPVPGDADPAPTTAPSN